MKGETEMEMREAEVPWIKTEEELVEYIRGLVDREHDYGTCVYAMSMAGVAAYNYVAGRLGATGFQASCADLDMLRRTRGLKYGFRLIDYEKLLYPQYSDREHFPGRADILDDPDTRKAIADAARERLAGRDGAHPNVVAHWEMLAGLAEATDG